MQKYIQITSNGELKLTPMKINRLTVSFGKEGTHVSIPSIDNHAFDLIFVSPKESKGFLKSYTSETIKINDLTVNDIAEIDNGDVIAIGQVSLLYYVDHPETNWKRNSELRRESITSSIQSDTLPPAVEVTKVQFKNPAVSFIPTIQKFEAQKITVEEISELVKNEQRLDPIPWNEQAKKKREMLSEVVINSNFGEQSAKLIENNAKVPIIKESPKTSIQEKKPTEKPVMLLGNQRKSQKATDSKKESTTDESDYSDAIVFKLGNDDESDGSLSEEESSPNESVSSNSENEKMEEEEEEETNGTEMSNIVDEDDDEELDDSLKMTAMDESRLKEIEKKEKRLEEAKEYAKKFDKRNKQNEEVFDEPTKRRQQSEPKGKKSIIVRQGVSGNTFYFGSNEILFVKFEKEIRMYGGICHNGYPEIKPNRITNEVDAKEGKLESKIFYVCEKGNEGLLMPYLCCILQGILVVSSTYLEDIVTHNTDYNEYLLPIFPLSSIQKGKLLHGYRIDMNSLPKQPIQFESYDPNEESPIPKFAPKRTNHSYGRQLTASDKIRKETEIHTENKYIELFIRKIGGIFIESSLGRNNAYDFYVEFLQENNENERKVTRHSFNPTTAGDFVDLTWVFEMLKSQHFIHPSEFSPIPPPANDFISSYDNF